MKHQNIFSLLRILFQLLLIVIAPLGIWNSSQTPLAKTTDALALNNSGAVIIGNGGDYIRSSFIRRGESLLDTISKNPQQAAYLQSTMLILIN